MSIFKNGKFYHYEFQLDGRRYRGSTGTANKQQAINEERRQRERLEKTYGQVIEEESRKQGRKTIQEAADEFLVDYKSKHASATYAVYALGHVRDHLGRKQPHPIPGSTAGNRARRAGAAACRQKRRVRFTPAAALVNELVEAKQNNQVRRLITRWQKYDLIAVD